MLNKIFLSHKFYGHINFNKGYIFIVLTFFGYFYSFCFSVFHHQNQILLDNSRGLRIIVSRRSSVRHIKSSQHLWPDSYRRNYLPCVFHDFERSCLPWVNIYFLYHCQFAEKHLEKAHRRNKFKNSTPKRERNVWCVVCA